MIIRYLDPWGSAMHTCPENATRCLHKWCVYRNRSILLFAQLIPGCHSRALCAAMTYMAFGGSQIWTKPNICKCMALSLGVSNREQQVGSSVSPHSNTRNSGKP